MFAKLFEKISHGATFRVHQALRTNTAEFKKAIHTLAFMTCRLTLAFLKDNLIAAHMIHSRIIVSHRHNHIYPTVIGVTPPIPSTLRHPHNVPQAISAPPSLSHSCKALPRACMAGQITRMVNSRPQTAYIILTPLPHLFNIIKA